MNQLDEYIKLHSSPEDELLKELDRVTNLKAVSPQMISGHIQGKLLEMLTHMLNPDTILEIGTFTGYSTLCFAAGMNENGRIDTIEIDDEVESISAGFFARSSNGYKIRQLTGSALKILPTLDEKYDMVFIDGDKREYPSYLNLLMGDNGNRPLVHKGSFIIADNILWYGKVAENAKDTHTRNIIAFNDMVRRDDRLDNVIVSVRDGLNLIRVIGEVG